MPKNFLGPGGGIGIRGGLKILCLSKDLWVRVPPWAPELNFQEFCRPIQPREARQSAGILLKKSSDFVKQTHKQEK